MVIQSAPARWERCSKADLRLVRLADRHYTRQKPGTRQFCRPGINFALLLSDGSAGWVVWRPIPQVGRLDRLEAWECTFFRNEGTCRSSEFVRDATELTYRAWGWPPTDGLITAVGIAATARRRSKHKPPGVCYLAAGWTPIAERGGLLWLRAPHPARQRRITVTPPHASISTHPPGASARGAPSPAA